MSTVKAQEKHDHAACQEHGHASNGDPSKRSPFVHFFKTCDHYYIYDVNTNRILQASQVLWDLLKCRIGWEPIDELIQRLPQHRPQDVREAARLCEELHQELGVFSSFRPKRLYSVDATSSPMYENGMQQLIIETTQACNLRCKYCTYSEFYPVNRDYTNKTIPFETAAKAIDYFLARSTDAERPCISFYGGEPLLRFDLIRQCIEYGHQQNELKYGGKPLKFSMTTNATLITEEMADYFIERSVTLLISLDGPEGCNDENRVFVDGRPTASKILAALKMLKSKSPEYYENHIGMNSVIAPNVDLIATFEFFQENEDIVKNGAYVSSFVNDTNSDYWKENAPSKEWRESLETLRWNYYESLIMGQGESPDRFLHEMFGDDFLKIYRRPIVDEGLGNFIPLNGCCVPGTRRLYVDCTGKYHICERITTNAPIGDVDNGLDHDRINEVVKEYRGMSEKECTNCWLQRFCSVCFQSCRGAEGFDQAEKRALCRSKRKSFNKALVDYSHIAEINPAAFKFMDDILIK